MTKHGLKDYFDRIRDILDDAEEDIGSQAAQEAHPAPVSQAQAPVPIKSRPSATGRAYLHRACQWLYFSLRTYHQASGEGW